MTYPSSTALLTQADDNLEAAKRWFVAAERRLAATQAARSEALAMVEVGRDE